MPGWSSSTTISRAPRPARTRAPRPGRAPAPGSSRARRRRPSTRPACAALNTAATSAPGLRVRMLELLLDQVGPVDALAPVLPELRLERAERDPAAVLGLVGEVAEDAARQLDLAAAGHVLLAEVARHDHRQPRQRAVGHRDVDELPLARALALVQRGEDSDRRHQAAAAEVRDLAGRLDRRAVRGARSDRAGRSAPGSWCRARSARVSGPVLAVARDRAVDEPRVALAQRLVADAEPVHARRAGSSRPARRGPRPAAAASLCPRGA